MSFELPEYSFLPWSRRGISTRVDQTDHLGTTPAAGPKDRASMTASLTLESVPVPGAVAIGPTAVSKQVSLIGPGDVKSFRPDVVLRVAPVPGSVNATPGELAYVEFYDEDFPWRYTPARATTDHRLRPWVVLLVLAEGEYSLTPVPGQVSILTVNDTAPLPELTETWAWAHVQTHGDLTGGDPGTKLNTQVNATPDLALSRLISPRRLDLNTGYRAFVVPGFELGRLAGLGTPAQPGTVPAQQPAWGQGQPRVFPVFYEWSFRTGELADFEVLARRPKAFRVEAKDGFGTRALDVSHPGAGIEVPPGTTVGFEGALAPLDFDGRTPFPASPGTQLAGDLRDVVDLAVDFQVAGTDDGEDPIVTPPAYARRHAGLARVADATTPDNRWVAELNLDPRNRAAAGLGAEIVRQRDEEYMERAWAQVERLDAVNQRLREREKLLALYVEGAVEATAPVDLDCCCRRVGQSFFRATRGGMQIGLPCRRQRACEAPGIEGVLGQRRIKVVAAEMGITRRRQHLEHATRQAQDRHVKGAAAEVVDQESAFSMLVESVRDGRSSGLVEQPQYVQSRELGSVFGGLTLRVVEVCWHRDHGAIQRAAKALLRAILKRTQNLRRDFNRRHRTLPRGDLELALAITSRRRELVACRGIAAQVSHAAAHEAFDRSDGVERIIATMRERRIADLDHALFAIAHGRRQHGVAIDIGQALGHRVTNGRDQRVGGPEIYAHRQPSRVRFGAFVGLGNLQQRHACFFCCGLEPGSAGYCSRSASAASTSSPSFCMKRILRASVVMAWCAVFFMPFTLVAQPWLLARTLDEGLVPEASRVAMVLDDDLLFIAISGPDGGTVIAHQKDQGGLDQWGVVGTLHRDDPWFGGSIALHGDRLAVGSPGTDGAGPFTGEVRLYAIDQQPGQDVLQPLGVIALDDATSNDRFGYTVHWLGDTLAVSAVGRASARSLGKVFLFTLNGSVATWTGTIAPPVQELQVPFIRWFGASMAHAGDRLAIAFVA